MTQLQNLMNLNLALRHSTYLKIGSKTGLGELGKP